MHLVVRRHTLQYILFIFTEMQLDKSKKKSFLGLLTLSFSAHLGCIFFVVTIWETDIFHHCTGSCLSQPHMTRTKLHT